MAGMSKIQIDEPLRTHTPSLPQDDGIDVLDILVVLAHNRRLIGLVTLTALLLGGVLSFLLRPTFTATTTILPPQQPQSTVSAMMGQLGSLAGLGGAGGLLKNPADLYIGMITSRTVADRIIERFHLQALYKSKTMVDARRDLSKHITAEAEKNGLIEISVKDRDPRRASDIANGLVDELYHLTSSLAITEAAQRRLFFDEQLDQEKAALAAAEEDLRKTQEKTGLIQLSGQAEEIIRGVANLRAQVVSREVELQAMRTYATDQNPDVTRLQQEIDALQKQLSTMENNQRRMQPGDIQVPTGQVPEAGLEYARKVREVTYHTTLLTLLSREYEGARIDEAKSAPLIQVVDRAVPPDKKSGPYRALLTLAAGFLAFVGACFWTYVKHMLTRIKQIPENAQKLEQLRALLRGRAAARPGALHNSASK
jgi:tyrosine-protein kinase Etk/Wzc